MNKEINWEIDQPFDEFPKEIKKVYQDQFIILRKSFSSWIDLISKKFKKNIDWWSSFSSSRNPNYSNLYHFICVVETLKVLNKKKYSVKLTTKSKALFNFLKNDNKFNKKFKLTYINKEIPFLRNISQLLKSLFFQLYVFTFVKIIIRKRKINQDTLINTYPTASILKPERLFQFSDKFGKKNFLFVPSFIITKNVFSLSKQILNIKNKNYIFKEHYLKFSDLVYALCFVLRTHTFHKKYPFFKKKDYSNLIFDEILNFKNLNTTIIGVLNYHFAYRLKEKNIKIRKVISWFENHEVKGWNYGFRKYFKKINSIGYLGSVPLLPLMNSFPTIQEQQSKVIPKTFVVISKKYFKILREFNKNVSIKLGPALIFKEIFKKFKKKKKIKYLVVLSEFKKINEQILKWISFINKRSKNIKFLIKKPKITDMSEAIKLYKDSNVIFTDEYLPDLFKKSEFVITSGLGVSTSVMEAMAYECKILTPIIYPYDGMYLKRLNIPKQFYKVFNTKNEFLNFFLSSKRENLRNFKFKKFRNQFFHQKNEKVFFNLN